jgi:hypothetical protein
MALHLSWDEVDRLTSGPLCSSIAVLAVVALFGRQMLIVYRSEGSVVLSVATAVLTLAAFAIVTARLLALLR